MTKKPSKGKETKEKNDESRQKVEAMGYVKVGDIQIEDNPRDQKPDEDLDGLTASVKQIGVKDPIRVRKAKAGKYDLIYGSRRVRAAKAAGIKEILAIVEDVEDQDKITLSLIENIQRRDLTIWEEANALKQAVEATVKTPKQLGDLLGKPEAWVLRRLAVFKLSKEGQKAVKDNKLSLGHIAVISKLPEAMQANSIRCAAQHGHSVRNLILNVAKKSIKDACFDTKDCKGCQFNGGEQTLLSVEEGAAELRGDCLNVECYAKKVGEKLTATIQEFKEKKIAVIPKERYNINSNEWKEITDQKKALEAAAKKPEEYGVLINNRTAETEVFKRNHPKTTPKADDEADDEHKEGQLLNRIRYYRNDVLTAIAEKKIEPKTVENTNIGKAMVIYEFLNNISGYDEELYGAVFKEAKINPDDEPDLLLKLCKLSTPILDEMLHLRGKELIEQDHSQDEILVDVEVLGVDLAKDWKIDAAFLELHTIPQLKQLFAELFPGVNITTLHKKTELIEYMLQQKIDGKVPKNMIPQTGEED